MLNEVCIKEEATQNAVLKIVGRSVDILPSRINQLIHLMGLPKYV